MIKNERQYTITKARVRRLEALQDELLDALPSAGDGRLRKELELKAVAAEIKRMSQEIEEYEGLQSGTRPVVVTNLEEFPRDLIRARIAANLTQQDLASRLGLKEQQIQRYEATNYESASLERLLEVARALKLDTSLAPSASVSLAALLPKVEALGLDRRFILRRIAPHAASDEQRALSAMARLTRIYGVDPDEVLEQTARLDESEFAAAAYKMPERARRATALALSGYAKFLSGLAARIAPGATRILPSDAMGLRELAAADGPLSFESVLRLAWDCGVVVIPLLETGGFHAGYWRHGDRYVVVLNPVQRYPARWLFDLLHELGHIVLAPSASLVEVEPGSADAEASDSEEDQANEYATSVLFGEEAASVFERVMDLAGGRKGALQRTVTMVARQGGFDAGALAMNVAFRLSQQGTNWWGPAAALVKSGEDPWAIARDEFVRRVDWGSLDRLDAELLSIALGDTSDGDTGSDA